MLLEMKWLCVVTEAFIWLFLIEIEVYEYSTEEVIKMRIYMLTATAVVRYHQYYNETVKHVNEKEK